MDTCTCISVIAENHTDYSNEETKPRRESEPSRSTGKCPLPAKPIYYAIILNA